ncbi:hypothetical protein PIB30_069043 [Stylosanthes scabra]|uniref:Uncharacterized protein n=1 Tax=Stylosanthes scabra TaxID=79078 RepID=A0ABU6XNS2_9FABA|nr:hypothetical protein [Stylosanthes scabra]
MPRKPRYKLPTSADAVTDAQTGGNSVATMEKRAESSSVHPRNVSDKSVVTDAHTRGNSVATMEKRTASSSVQPRNVSDNPPSTGGGPQQATRKVRQFCPPRSEARPAKSARIVFPQVPAAREYSRSHADLEDTYSEDEDYNPEADVDKSLEEHLDNLSEREDVRRRGKETTRKNRDLWEVHVIENGVEKPEKITSNKLFSLPLGRQVVLSFDVLLRPCGQAAGSTLTQSLSIAENVQHRCPEGIDEDDWQAFLEYRLVKDTLEKCRKNAENRAKQTYTHVGGSKSLARRTEEEEIRHGRHFSRGDMWTIVHRRKDGSYIHDDARAIGEAIADIESRDESTKELSQNDSLAQVLGKEHSG